MSVHLRFTLDKVGTGPIFSRNTSVSPVSIILPMPHTHLRLHVTLSRRTNGELLAICRGTFVRKVLSYCVLVSSALAPFWRPTFQIKVCNNAAAVWPTADWRIYWRRSVAFIWGTAAAFSERHVTHIFAECSALHSNCYRSNVWYVTTTRLCRVN
jgi:hypothetical protein